MGSQIVEDGSHILTSLWGTRASLVKMNEVIVKNNFNFFLLQCQVLWTHDKNGCVASCAN
jgi:hypothetical protein